MTDSVNEIDKNEYTGINDAKRKTKNAQKELSYNNTLQLIIDDNNYTYKDQNEDCIGPTRYDVFINNGKRNHLQYLSLQDTPYLNTKPFRFEDETNEKKKQPFKKRKK